MITFDRSPMPALASTRRNVSTGGSSDCKPLRAGAMSSYSTRRAPGIWPAVKSSTELPTATTTTVGSLSSVASSSADTSRPDEAATTARAESIVDIRQEHLRSLVGCQQEAIFSWDKRRAGGPAARPEAGQNLVDERYQAPGTFLPVRVFLLEHAQRHQPFSFAGRQHVTADHDDRRQREHQVVSRHRRRAPCQRIRQIDRMPDHAV